MFCGLWDLKHLIRQFMGVFGLVNKLETSLSHGGKGRIKMLCPMLHGRVWRSVVKTKRVRLDGVEWGAEISGEMRKIRYSGDSWIVDCGLQKEARHEVMGVVTSG